MSTLLAVSVLCWAVPCGVRCVYGLAMCHRHRMPLCAHRAMRGVYPWSR